MKILVNAASAKTVIASSHPTNSERSSVSEPEGSRKLGDYPDSRIYPADDHQTLDDVASTEPLAGLAAADLVGQRGEGGDADEIQQPSDYDGNQMGEETESDMVAHGLEAE